MTAHEKEKIIKYGYEKCKKENHKKIQKNLTTTAAFIGMAGLVLTFCPPRDSIDNWLTGIIICLTFILFILSIINIINCNKQNKYYREFANEHKLDVIKSNECYEIKCDEITMVVLEAEEINNLLQ